MKITFEKLLLIIIVLLLVFLVITGNKDKGLYEYLNKSNKEIQLQIDSLKNSVIAKVDSIRSIDSTIVITRFFHIKEDEQIQNISTDTAAVAYIRKMLLELGSSKYD